MRSCLKYNLGKVQSILAANLTYATGGNHFLHMHGFDRAAWVRLIIKYAAGMQFKLHP